MKIKLQEKNKIYALINPDGLVVSCGTDVADVVSYTPLRTTNEMWGDLFSASTVERVYIFRANGWKVLKGDFVNGEDV